MITPKIEEGLFLFSTGLFAGMALFISYAVRRIVNSSNRPRDTWNAIYESGKTFAIGTVLVAVVSGAVSSYRTRDGWILAATILIALPMVWTIGVILKTVKVMQESDNEDENFPVLLNRWFHLHNVRTILSFAAFICGLIGIL